MFFFDKQLFNGDHPRPDILSSRLMFFFLIFCSKGRKPCFKAPIRHFLCSLGSSSEFLTGSKDLTVLTVYLKEMSLEILSYKTAVYGPISRSHAVQLNIF